MNGASLNILDRLLTEEEGLLERLKKTRSAKQLSKGRQKLLTHIRKVGRGHDVSLIIATEKKIIEGDLERYANSKSMTASLQMALDGMNVIQKHLALVNDKDKYPIIDQGHSMVKNRRNGLPFDEARQALASHHARLLNMDKSRADEDEKDIIDARKAAIFHAGELYAGLQANTLGIDFSQNQIQQAFP